MGPHLHGDRQADGDCGDANLRMLRRRQRQLRTAAASDDFCGIVNPGTITTAPWPFTDKSGNANSFLNGEFYEGGINLSLLGLGDECFSSVASETRSSTSTTATLKDFVLGGFGACGASLVTTPSGDGDTQRRDRTATVSDSAEITSTAREPPAPTGSVKFYLCGPSATALTSCDATGTLKSTINLSTATRAETNSPSAPGTSRSTHPATTAGSRPGPATTNYVPDGSRHRVHRRQQHECFSITSADVARDDVA